MVVDNRLFRNVIDPSSWSDSRSATKLKSKVAICDLMRSGSCYSVWALICICQWIFRSKVKGQVDSGGDEVGAFLLEEQNSVGSLRWQALVMGLDPQTSQLSGEQT